nr:MAG TPA: hypothetical protein [Bacteriophage sp.]
MLLAHVYPTFFNRVKELVNYFIKLLKILNK